MGRNRAGVTSFKELQSNRTQMPSCGEVQTSRQCNKVSKFLGHLLATTITCKTNWKGLPVSTNASWTCCLQCRTSSRVGCFFVHCASAKANYLLRTVCPDSVRGFADAHGKGLWECVCALLNIPIHQDQSTRDKATLPFFGIIGSSECRPN